MISLNETAGRKSISMPELETLCSHYNNDCLKLEEMIAALEADLDAVKQKHLRGLKRQAATTATSEAILHSAIESVPELFEKPRSVVMHGTKIGYSTSVGSVEFEDEDQVVARIEKHFKPRFDELVKTTRKPRKDALRTLAPAELAKLGCAIDGAGDVVLLTRVAGDVEKLLDTLVKKLVEAMVKESDQD